MKKIVASLLSIDILLTVSYSVEARSYSSPSRSSTASSNKSSTTPFNPSNPSNPRTLFILPMMVNIEEVQLVKL